MMTFGVTRPQHVDIWLLHNSICCEVPAVEYIFHMFFKKMGNIYD